jgi:separase
MDDQVLELFIGLGTGQDGQLDLDEPLSDLLYFVVDMLQFNGERNAYDEIDFDSMSIEVLDALRSYHDSVDENRSDAAHLILVLDRRLHAFPWESLPCLQDSSVSRVDSMLTLRDRLLEMQSKEGRYTVSKKTGSYILNPGGDLKGTESTMGPELTKLAQGDSFEWTSIVRREPSEDEFKAALSASATLMYFGHGSGAQYIRPRAIRRLEQCSEVVWLMGCSSGAVQEHGELEPYAVPLAYLAAGRPREIPSIENIATRPSSNGKCMAVLATLWDVTDKDIDRFSLAVGEEWGLWRPPPEYTTLPVKTPKKRVIAAPVTPQKTAKTPKTPKVKQTPTAPKTPARSASRQPSSGLKGTRSLVEAVAKSRDACYLRYLNGAAPVVYGVPVWLGD